MTAYLEVKFREIKPQNSAQTGLPQKIETFQKQHKYRFNTDNYSTWKIFIYSQHISGTNPQNKHMKESKHYHEKKLKHVTSITLGFCFRKRALNKLVFHHCWRRTKNLLESSTLQACFLKLTAVETALRYIMVLPTAAHINYLSIKL